jgi:arylsulfatase A-like enzyme
MNILMIDVDTLSAEHLRCYGYSRTTSPAIDTLASEGALFENCIAPGIPTTPAHATMFTGLHPLTHRVVTHGGAYNLPDQVPMLAGLLQKAGLTTCAVDNLYDLKKWLARGFEFYINPAQRHRLGLMVSCDDINRRAIPWLKQHASEPFFMFVHYWDPHTPYLPPTRYRNLYYEDGDPCDPNNHSLDGMERQPFGEMWRQFWFPRLGGHITDAEYVVAMYDSEVRYLNDGLRDLLHALDETGKANETLVLLTSDHGESMYQHDIFFDHHGLYECNVRVPLIVRFPGQVKAGQRHPGLVQHTDLAPTLLEAAGAVVPETMEGQSLLPALLGQAEGCGADRVFLEECTWQAKWGIRTPQQKFILSREMDHHRMPRTEFYDLQADPAETHNLADDLPDEAASLEAELEEWIQRGLERTGQKTDPVVEQGITLGKKWDKY